MRKKTRREVQKGDRKTKRAGGLKDKDAAPSTNRGKGRDKPSKKMEKGGRGEGRVVMRDKGKILEGWQEGGSEFRHKAQPQFFINSALAENKSFLFF